MFSILANTVKMAHGFIQMRLGEGGIGIDATAGNGNDTLFLSKCVGNTGRVFSFDIQKMAIEKTMELLESKGFSQNITLINAGHEKMKEYINQPVDAIIFNLGYLPGGDHSVTTNPDTTIEAVKAGLSLLKSGGILCIVVYTGHPGGEAEQEALESFMESLDKQNFCSAKLFFLNRIKAPYLILVEKSLGGSQV